MKACGFRPTVLLETDGMSEKSVNGFLVEVGGV